MNLKERMEAIEKRVEEHEALLKGNGDKDGVLSRLRQLCEEAKGRKAMQATILIGVAGLLAERVFRMVGLLFDKM